MLAPYILYGVFGRIVIFFLQNFATDNSSRIKSKFLSDLFGCDLCLGVWVYSILAGIFNYSGSRINILDGSYIPIISEVLTGMCFSFLVHLLRLGWQDKFGIMEIK